MIPLYSQRNLAHSFNAAGPLSENMVFIVSFIKKTWRNKGTSADKQGNVNRRYSRKHINKELPNAIFFHFFHKNQRISENKCSSKKDTKK